jgi:hypothetical protein
MATPSMVESYFKVAVIALPRDAQTLCFYTTDIPQTLLDQLDRPSQPFSMTPISIVYDPVPVTSESRVRRAMGNVLCAQPKKAVIMTSSGLIPLPMRTPVSSS